MASKRYVEVIGDEEICDRICPGFRLNASKLQKKLQHASKIMKAIMTRQVMNVSNLMTLKGCLMSSMNK